MFRVLPYAWMAVIFFVSHTPSSGLPPVQLFPHADKFIHAGVYGFLIALFALSKPATQTMQQRMRFAVPLSILYAISDEIHQRFVPGRSADILDFLADTAGVIIAATFFVSREQKSG